MPTTTETTEDALDATAAAFATAFTDYDGTVEYLQETLDDEVDELRTTEGMTYLPDDPTGGTPIGDFFETALGYVHTTYVAYAAEAVRIDLKQMSSALSSTRPQSATFGQLMGHFLSGNNAGFFSTASDASLMAKTIAKLSIGTAAATGGIQVFTAEDPLSEGQKQGFALGGMLLGAEMGIKLTAFTGQPLIMAAGAVTGGIAGSLAGQAFYESDAWTGIHDDLVNTAANAIEAADMAFAAAGDYVDEIWDESGQAAQDLFDDFLDGVDGFLDLLGDLGDENSWEPPELPDWLDLPLGWWGDAPEASSPIIFDMDGDGIEATAFDAATTRTFFDLAGGNDGIAEQTAWVGADDGLLVRDLNENGTIDNAGELFGSATVDGFALLQELDTNGDLIINQYDDDFGDLKIWIDADGDARTDAGELQTLAYHDIVSIDLAGVQASASSVNGNPISHTTTFKYANGSTAAAADVWFVHDTVNTYYNADYTFDTAVFALPTLRGYGQIPSLHIAMSLDEDLLDLVEDFTLAWDYDRWADATSLNSDLEDILYEWAGVDGVSPSSRGPNIDARKLEFMEKFFGEDFVQGSGTLPNPYPNAANTLMNVWDALVSNFKAALVTQLTAGELYDAGVSYDVFAGQVDGTFALSEDAFGDLVAFASAGGVDTEAYWQQVADYIDSTKGLSNVTGTEEGWLDTAVYDSGLTSSDWQDILDSMAPEGWNLITSGTGGNDTIYGSSAADQLGGSAGDDIIYGYEGDDELYAGYSGTNGSELYAGDGNDYLEGDTKNDILDSGAGGDFAYGRAGDDTYVYTAGDDFYSEYSGGGTDKITLPSGITSNDLSFHSNIDESLVITVGTLGTIEIEDHFYSAGRQIEEIEFYDTSTLDLTAFTEMDRYGTDEADTILGEYSFDDTIYGLAGDDTLDSKTGNDTLIGGAGNDTLKGGGGDDTYVAGEGFDWVAEQNGGGSDKIVIPEGYTLDDVTLLRLIDGTSLKDLTITIAGLGQIRVDDQFYAANSVLESLYFEEDESSFMLSTATIETRGDENNNSLSKATVGHGTNQLFNGMGGDDSIVGGSGDDTYIFSEGDDKITDNAGGTDTLIFWEGWTPDDISIYRQEAWGFGWDDLVLEDQSGNSVIISNHFDGGNYTFEYVEFHDTTVWDIVNMVIPVWGTSGNDSVNSLGSGNHIVYGFDGNDNLTTYTGNDTLDGGAGNDNLYGTSGDDLYYYESGLDKVTDTSGTETLIITGGVTINDITIADEGSYDALIVINSGTDEINLDNEQYSATYHIENLAFEDGFITDQLPDYNNWSWGTASGDTLSGTSGADVIIGLAGADTIDGGDGADDIHGGADADDIDGDAGDDMLHGGAGDDVVDGGADNDVIFGGDGEDDLYGGSGADIFGFVGATAFNDVDGIYDFSTGDGDKLNIADILDGFYEYGTDAITDFVQITDDSTDSTLSIDQNGGGDNFVAVATLFGVTGLTDEAALESAGTLITSGGLYV